VILGMGAFMTGAYWVINRRMKMAALEADQDSDTAVATAEPDTGIPDDTGEAGEAETPAAAADAPESAGEAEDAEEPAAEAVEPPADSPEDTDTPEDEETNA
jgi:hypothetical protein